MRLVSRLLWFSLIVGCNPVTTPTTAPLGLQVLGSVEVPFVRDTAPRLEGARVCELDNDEKNCVPTDEGGYATIELPFEEETAYTIDAEGYDPTLIPEVIAKSGIDHWWAIPSVELTADFYKRVMSPYPHPATGEIYIQTNPKLAGVTFNLPGATGKPYYTPENLDEESPLDPTATTSTGEGGFVEVPPGTFRIEFGGAAEECVPRPSGWPREDGFWVPVRKGYFTWISVTCQ